MPNLPHLFSLKRNPPPPSTQQFTTSNPHSASTNPPSINMPSTTNASSTMPPPTDTSARLLATVANLKITPTPPTSLSPTTIANESPHHWFMHPRRHHRHGRHPLAPPSGINLPVDYGNDAKMLLRYVDACLKEEKRKEEGAEREFWTGERVARRARMEGGRGVEGGTHG